MVNKKIKLLLLLLIIQLFVGSTAFGMTNYQYQYEYDDNNRLIGIKMNGEYVKRLVYDNNGNLLSTSTGNRPEVSIAMPNGTVHNPTSYIVEDDIIISWNQTDEDINNTFRNFQVHIYNESNQIIYDSGSMAQNTASSNYSYILPSTLDIPKDEVLKVMVRVSDMVGWSQWSSAQFFRIQSPINTTNLLLNPDFETEQTSNDFGWDKSIAENAIGSIDLVTDQVQSGSKALKISVSGLQAWENGQVRQDISVQQGEAYSLSGHVYVEQLSNAYAQFSVWFFDANGQFIAEQNVKHESTTEGYIKLERKGKIPQGAARAEVHASIVAHENNGSGIVYIDAMRFAYGTDNNIVTNGGFEHSSGSDLSVWRKYLDDSGTNQVSVMPSPAQGGGNALKIEASGLLAWRTVQAVQEFEVEGGQPFKLSGEFYAEQLQNAAMEMQIVFLDENNQNVFEDKVSHDQSTAGFIPLEKTGIIPAGATKARVFIWLLTKEDNGGGAFYADNIHFMYSNE